MFKKRGQRSNIRRKAASSDDEEEKADASALKVAGVPLPGLRLGGASARADAAAHDDNRGGSMLSFAGEEEEEGPGAAGLRLKKSAQKRLSRLKKAAKEKETSPDSTRNDTPPPLPPRQATPPKPPPPKVRVAEADSSTGDQENLHAYNPDSKLRTAMRGGEIPDAKMVFMARKRRQAAREGGDIIPLDDTQRYQRRGKGRLIREEDEDGCSSGEEGGRFYSRADQQKAEEEERRAGQDIFLEREQGDSDGSAEEFDQWEIDRIRKCLPNEMVSQMEEAAEESRRKRLYAQHGSLGPPPERLEEEAMELESADVRADIRADQIPLPPGRSNGRSGGLRLGGGDAPPTTRKPATLAELLDKLKLGTRESSELIRARELEVEKLGAHLVETETTLAGLEKAAPGLQTQFSLFQDTRAYVLDLLDCLNEKAPVITEVVEKLGKVASARSEGLWKRRAQETRDEFEAISVNPRGVGLSAAPEPALLLRVAEREGRRSRRRQEREKRPTEQHHDGLSTDEEEIPSKMAATQAELKSVRDEGAAVMEDALEEYRTASGVLGIFDRWLREDAASFREAYIALCFPKLLAPLVQLELLAWNPFEGLPIQDVPSVRLEEMSWYQACLRLGATAEEDDSVVELIPNLVDKVVLPHLTGLIRTSWDPTSRRQTRELRRLLAALERFPTVAAASPRVARLVEAVAGRAKEAADELLFTPILTAALAPSARAFLDRQFWAAQKVLSNVMSLSGWVSPGGIEELALDGVLNRHLVLSLQSGALDAPSTLPKLRATLDSFPVSWVPTDAAATQPLAKLLLRAADAIRIQPNSREAEREIAKMSEKLLGKSRAQKMEA